MATNPRFIPPHPPRPARPGSFVGAFFGERARNVVAGFSHESFAMPHRRWQGMGWTVHFITDPDALQQVMLTNVANYEKPKAVKKLLSPLLGRGLLSSDGELWRGQRKVVAPTFAPGAVDALIPLIAGATARRIESWPAGASERCMAQEATALTMEIIADALFSGDARLKTPEARGHITAALEAASGARLAVLLGLPLLPVTEAIRRGRRGRLYLRSALEAIVRDRGDDGGADDFLGGMIRAFRAQYARAEADALAVDNAATFWLAGHETTANALAWTIFLLAAQPGAQERARDEALAAIAPGTDAGLPERLPFLRQILDESLRLYPPAPRFDREAVGADVLRGLPVKAGDIVSIWPWLIHRQRDLWDDPDAFDPERFSPERKAAQHRFQYIPFGAGPRVCVGARFAIVEALVILAQWLAARRFTPLPGTRVEPFGSVTLRPRGGMPLRLSSPERGG